MNLEDSMDRLWYEVTVNQLRNRQDKCMKDISCNTSMYLDLIKFRDKATVSSIADDLDISKAAVTMKVNELVKQGLVKKVQSEEDKRINYLEVTDTISEDYEIYFRPLRHAIETIREKYTQEKIDVFCEVLETFSDCFQSCNKAHKEEL